MLHDARADFDATVGGKSPAQDAWFENVENLPLQVYRLDSDTEPQADPEHPGEYDAYPTETTQVRGFDSTPIQVTMDARLTRVDGRWRMLSLRLYSLDNTVAEPWDLAGTTVSAQGKVVVVSQGVDAAGRDRLLRLAAAARVRDVTSLPAGVALPGVVVLAFRSGPLKHDFSSAEIALLGGITVPVPDDTLTPSTKRIWRVILAPAEVRHSTDAEMTHILRHEMIHVATEPKDGGGDTDPHFAPAWIQEGVAEFYSWRDDPHRELPYDAIRAAYAGTMTTLPPDSTFHDASLSDWYVHYGESWWAMEALADRAGIGAPADLMRAYDAERLWKPGALDAYLEKTAHVDSDGLARAAQQLIVRHFRPPPA